MDTIQIKPLFINIALTQTDPTIEYLRDTAKIEFDYRQLDELKPINEALHEQPWDLLVLKSAQADSRLGNCVEVAQQLQPPVPVIVILETTTVQEAVDLMRQGVRGVVEAGDEGRLLALIQEERHASSFNPKTAVQLQNSPQHSPNTIHDTQKALEQREKLLRLFIEYTPAAIAMFDRDMRYLAVSRRFLTDYHLSEQSIVGRYHYDVFPEIPEQTREINRRCLQGAIEAREKEPFLRADGTLDWVRWEVRPWFDSQGEIGGILLFSEVITDRIRSEEALQESHALLEQRVSERTTELEKTTHRLEAIFNHSGDGIVLLNIHHGLQQVNQAFADAFGVEPNQCPGTPLSAYFEPGEAEQIDATVRAVAEAHQTRRIEAQARRADGTNFEVEISLAPVNRSIHAVTNLVGIIRDVTVRKAQERQLRYHASVQANMSDAVIVTDMNLHIQSWNPAAERIYGWTEAEVLGRDSGGILRPEFQSTEELQQVMEKVRAGGWWQAETIQRHKDGSPIHILGSVTVVNDTTGKAIGIVAVNRDISIRKRVEEALRESESRYRLLAENIRDVVARMTPDGIRTFVTPSCFDLLGYRPEELVGQPGFDIVLPEDRPRTQALLQQALTTGADKFIAEHRVVHKNGHVLWGELSASIVRDKQGKFIEIIGIIHDITERKQAEEIREKYAADVHDLYNKAPCGYHSLNPDGLIVEINDTELQWLGYNREEVVGKLRAADILAPKSIAILGEQLPILKKTGNRSNIEVEFKRKDGSLFPVLLNASATYDEIGAFVQSRSSIFDITELKQAQKALSESEQRYRTLIASMSEGIVMQAQDGTILTCNAAAERILGLTYDQLIGRTSVDPRWRAVHEDGSPFPGETHPAMITLTTGKPQTNVVMGVHKPDGSQRWILVNSQPLFDTEQTLPYAVVTTFTDITERKQTEGELEALSQRLQLATETGGIGIWDWDIQTDTLVWDGQMFRLYGLNQSTFTGKTLDTWESGLLHPEDFRRMHDEMQLALIGDGTLDTEFRITRPDGQLRHLKVKAVIFRDGEGQPMRMIGVNWDITLLKQAEEGLRLALEKEKEVGELKSRFVSVASHEFRTPLATILATTETLTIYRERMDETQIDNRLGKIRHQVNHMREIMDDVLQLARIQARRIEFHPADSDLKALCQDIMEEFQSRAEYRDRIIFTGPAGPVMVWIDLHLMRQIISNLVSNALKYSPADTAIQFELSYDAERVRCRVVDRGMGIPPEDLKHLFEPFHRAGNVRGIAGTGLGLSIVHEAVLTHGGSIEVESEVGQGTTFTVLLPFTRQEP
jgi:PAS domain S-box-containing protein